MHCESSSAPRRSKQRATCVACPLTCTSCAGGGALPSTSNGSAAAYPGFPPRTQPAFCAVAGDAAGGSHWPRVSTVKESMRRKLQAIRWLRRQACQCNCSVVGGGEMMVLGDIGGGRVFPRGLAHVRGLCGPGGRSLDVSLSSNGKLGRHMAGSNNLVVHGTAVEAEGATGSAPLDSYGTASRFAVIARFRMERKGLSRGESGTLQGRAVPCTPAVAGGGRCAALKEACTSLLSLLTTTLELQGVPGWPQLYGVWDAASTGP